MAMTEDTIARLAAIARWAAYALEGRCTPGAARFAMTSLLEAWPDDEQVRAS